MEAPLQFELLILYYYSLGALCRGSGARRMMCWAAPLLEDASGPNFVSGPSTVDFWNPARHRLTVVCVRRPKLFRQRPLFIQNHQQVDNCPKHRGVAQEPPGPKQQALAQQDHH